MSNKKEFLGNMSAFFPIEKEDLTNIYFIVVKINKNRFWDNRVKIGISKNVKKRMGVLKTGNPFDLSIMYSFKIEKSRAKYLENSLHRKFNWSHVSGEWFQMHPCIKEWVVVHKRECDKRSMINYI